MCAYYKKSELLLMRRATASVESGTTSEIIAQPVIITRFEGGTQIWRHRTENSFNLEGQILYC